MSMFTLRRKFSEFSECVAWNVVAIFKPSSTFGEKLSIDRHPIVMFFYKLRGDV